MPNKLKSLYAILHSAIHPKLRLSLHRCQNFIDKNNNIQVLYCIGDSHNLVFEYIKKSDLLSISTRCVTIHGATIFGLANPNSKTNSLPIFKNELINAPPDSILTIMLGEIDCGFLIWLRSNNNDTSIEYEMKESINRYKEFLLWVKTLSFSKIIVVSVPPQTISDDKPCGQVANIRKSINASIYERTILTKKYNEEVHRLTREINVDFLDMDDYVIDNKTGYVHEYLLNKDPSNHHLCTDTSAPLYAEKLKPYISNKL